MILETFVVATEELMNPQVQNLYLMNCGLKILCSLSIFHLFRGRKHQLQPQAPRQLCPYVAASLSVHVSFDTVKLLENRFLTNFNTSSAHKNGLMQKELTDQTNIRISEQFQSLNLGSSDFNNEYWNWKWKGIFQSWQESVFSFIPG